MAWNNTGCDNSAAWGSFSGGTVGTKTFTFVTGTPPATESVAHVVLDTFNITRVGSGGGSLEGVDIKAFSATEALKLSLIEEYAQTSIYKEAIVNEYGEVEFIEIGGISGNITDIYYTLQSTEYQTNVTSAIVTGRKELPERILRDKKDLLENRLDFDVTGMMTTCSKPNFSSYYTIVYDDPHLSSAAAYADGIENIYQDNNLNPFQRVVGWVYDIDTTVGGAALPPYVQVKFNNTASVPLMLSGQIFDPSNESVIDDPPWNADLGVLKNREPAGPSDLRDCWEAIGYGENDYGDVDCDASGILKVVLDPSLRYENIRGCQKDKFLQVAKVWFIAAECESIRAVPKDFTNATATQFPTNDNANIYVSLKSMRPKIIGLGRGEHYGIGYDTNTGTICAKFLANTRQNEYLMQYGNETTFWLDPNCKYAQDTGKTGEDDLKMTGTLYPAGGGRGYLIYQVWAQVDLETPSISIESPAGDAREYAANISAYIQAIIVEDPPPYVAINGDLVDQTINFPDQDPTTVQDLEDTDYERKMKAIGYGEGVSITISSLSSSETRNLSQNLHDLMEADTGIETVYTCGPDCRPQLGGRGNSGGIINSVTYSYSDRGSYTISVQEGPMFIGGLSSISQGPKVYKTDTISEQGVVVGDYGDGTNFKVLIDGIGVREAVNCCPDVIRTGDKVSITIHNNPVEG